MSFSLIGRMLSNATGTAPPPPDYPLSHAGAETLVRARPGGIIDVAGAIATLLRAETGKSLFNAVETNTVVTAWGKIVDGKFEIHRFYFGSNMLQVLIGPDGRVVAGETKLFWKLAEVNPQTPEKITPSEPDEWDLWTKSVDGGQPLLTSPTMLWQNVHVFHRFWTPGNGPADAKLYEEWITDAAGTQVGVALSTMLFSRQLENGVTEWLQMAICKEGGERWIEAYVGLNVEPAEIETI